MPGKNSCGSEVVARSYTKKRETSGDKGNEKTRKSLKDNRMLAVLCDKETGLSVMLMKQNCPKC